MKKRYISDANFESSSNGKHSIGTVNETMFPWYARLNGHLAWYPDLSTNDVHTQWLQIDIGSVEELSGVITQGHESSWVTSFSVTYLNDVQEWSSFLNSFAESKVNNPL